MGTTTSMITITKRRRLYDIEYKMEILQEVSRTSAVIGYTEMYCLTSFEWTTNHSPADQAVRKRPMAGVVKKSSILFERW